MCCVVRLMEAPPHPQASCRASVLYSEFVQHWIQSWWIELPPVRDQIAALPRPVPTQRQAVLPQ